jgi:Rrf2 family protein
VLRISTQVRYGTRALVQIAGAYPGRAVPVKEIARVQRVSMKYLEHIVSSLKHAGLIRAVRGTKGGYVMTRPPRSVRLDQVVRALEGPPVVVECVDRPEACGRHASCPTRGVWVRIREAVDGVLESVTLQDLAEEARLKGGAPPASYEI